MLSELEIESLKLQGSFLEFVRIFYFLRTGRKFNISKPIGRESHHIIIMKELVKVLRGETKRLIINVAPRYGKTELLIHFIAWALSQYPKSNFLYVSYSHGLAKKQTHIIKQIVESPHYQKLFGVELREDTQSKDNFETKDGGSVYAVGSGGTITGRGAGIHGTEEFGGIICLDDLMKPDEATSDTIREGINNWYFNTLQSRTNSPNTPIVFIGQRLHEDDLANTLIKTGEWKLITLKSLDDSGNALYPEMHDRQTLLKMKEVSPYVFSAQHQQDPLPAGGGLFQESDFPLLEDSPSIISTFVTCDSAETIEEYNDATVFSFWGLYPIMFNGSIIEGMYGIHWIDCQELRIEPKDLKPNFLDFWASCLRYPIQPKFAAIEKKSTGVTLLSVLKNTPGLRTIDIERAGSKNSKNNRFITMQEYIGMGQVSLPSHGKHTQMCLTHMKKITANNAHRFDDIADTCYDAVKMALIDKIIIHREHSNQDYGQVASKLMSGYNQANRARANAYR